MRQKILSGLSAICISLLICTWLFRAVSDRSSIPETSLSTDDEASTSAEPAIAGIAFPSKVSYRASTAIIPNPERGFYYMVDCDRPIAFAELTAWRTREAHTLVLCSVNLAPFIDSNIDLPTLMLFDRNMATMRSAGMKAILRFSYSSDTGGADATLDRIKAHLDQLKPYLDKNKDVIAVVQAGFIGGWGEWAYSQHFGNLDNVSARNWSDRKAVADKLIQSVPVERMVQFRIPDYKRRFVGTAPLSAAEAFNGSAKSRMAHHNDCFLASTSDWGTYTNNSVEYPYLQADTAYVPMGGETCNYNPPRSNCATAQAELSLFHYSYLNANYHPDVLQALNTQGCLDDIRKRLGYRFVLKNGTYPLRTHAGDTFTFNLTLRNQGWAAPYNRREVELVLRNTATGSLYRFSLDTDPRLWLPGRKLDIRQTVKLPASLHEGTYDMLLNLPDPAPSLRNRPEYSIHLANDGTWEEETGFNRLGHVIEVKRPSTQASR